MLGSGKEKSENARSKIDYAGIAEPFNMEVYSFDSCVPVLSLDPQSFQLYTLAVVQAFLIAPFVSLILSCGTQYYDTPGSLMQSKELDEYLWRSVLSESKKCQKEQDYPKTEKGAALKSSKLLSTNPNYTKTWVSGLKSINQAKSQS
jgi:hypothetical protein